MVEKAPYHELCFLPCRQHIEAYQNFLAAPWFWLETFLGWIASHQIGMWLEYQSWRTSASMNSVGASTHPCLTPFDTGNSSENFPSFWIHAIMKLPHHGYELGWTAKLYHHFFLQRSTFGSWHFPWGCLAVEIMSLSGIRLFWSRCSFRQFNRTLASI